MPDTVDANVLTTTERTEVFRLPIKLSGGSHVIAPVPISSVTSGNAPHATVLLMYSPEAAAAIDLKRLVQAVADVLRGFPHLTGRLRFAAPHDTGNAPPYTLRFRRPWIEYGNDTRSDPGFLFVMEKRSSASTAALPSPVQGYDGVFDATPCNDPMLAPKIAAPLIPEHDDQRLPVAGMKLTVFADGGAALCLSASHVLCDAGSLGVFFRHVVARYRSAPEPPAPPKLDYRVLDSQAAGDLNSAKPDPELIETEKRLDVFRYDSWAKHPATPEGMQAAPAPEIAAQDAARGRPRGEPPRWDTMSTAPALAYLVEFLPADIERIYASTVGTSTAKISKQDAFVAHLWRLIARARGQTGDEVLDCAMACDSRRRLGTPLDPETPGCWNVCLGFQARAGDIVGAGGALVAAQRVRQAVDTVTPANVAAWLHKRAHDLDPTREFIVFPGDHTVCTTNWSRCAFYGHDADFGAGGPVLVHNPVTAFGGFACILRKCGDSTGDKWYEPGVVVALWLEEEVMPRFLADPELRG